MMIKMFKLIAAVCDLAEYDNTQNEEEHQIISVISFKLPAKQQGFSS
jgi:hypothetical protein